MKVTLDGTPLLGRQTGVGTYTRELLAALTGVPGVTLTASPVTVRTGGRPVLPPGVRWVHRPAPARLVHRIWSGEPRWPTRGLTAEVLAGACDVYHATNFVLPPLRRAAGVVTVHDLAFLDHTRTVTAASVAYRELVPRGIGRARVVFTPSLAVADRLLSAYPHAEGKVMVTPLGVDPGWSAAATGDGGTRRELGLPGEYLVFVGTLEPRKNLAMLLDAYAAAGPGVPPLVLAGGAGWGEQLRLPDGVRHTGYLPGEQLRAVVAGATALVLPSLDEGFGLPVLEALAAGTAVICSDLPVFREVAGDHARFVPLDADAWVDALRAAGPASPFAADAARRHAAGFSWARCAELTAAGYRRAAGS